MPAPPRFRSSRRRNWLGCLILALALVAWFAAPGLARRVRGTFGTTMQQCENRSGGTSSPINDCTGKAWVKGDLNINGSIYRQGDFVPFRLEMTGFVAGRTYSVRIGYDAVEDGLHAYDYLGSYDASAAPGQQIIPCDGFAGTAGPHACGQSPSTLAVPLDTNTTFPSGAFQAPGNFSAWGGTLQGATYVNPTPIGVDTPGTVERAIDVSFTAAGGTVILAWGGHVASALDWGPDRVYTSLKTGAPFHVRLKQIQESGQPPETIGNQELSMHAAALAPTAGLTTQVAPSSITTEQTVVDTATLTGTAAAGNVTGQVQFFICGPEASAQAAACLQGGTRVGGPQVVNTVGGGPNGQATITFPEPGSGPIDPGNYCFRAEYTPSSVANYSPAVHPTTPTTTECFVATLPPPLLTVTKICVPPDDPGLFNLLVDGLPLGGTAGTDVPCEGTTHAHEVAPGSHMVSETAGTNTSLSDYEQPPTIGGECAADGSITLQPGDSATCTITNVRLGEPTGFLTVTKVCVPSSDDQFEIQVNGIKVAELGCGETTSPIELPPGDHIVSEASGLRTSLSNYKPPVFDDACAADGTVTVVTDETVHCTITNTRIPPATTLTVRKVCFPVGDDGHFRVGIFRIDGHPVHRVVLPCHGTTGAVRVHPGTYVIRERGANGTDLSNYNRFIGGDCLSNGTVTIQAGDHARCRIVNVHKGMPPPAELTVTKVCVPADDGGRFDLTVDGQTETDVACGHSVGPVAVAAGEHHVSESAGTGTDLGDYTTTIGGDCAADGSVTLAAGQQATCTITNARNGTLPPEPPGETGTVEIQKQCLPAGTTGNFQLELDEHIFHLACGESTGPVVIPIGDHRVGEVAVGRVTSRFITTIGGDCSPSGSFTLGAGEHVVCIVTNTLQAPITPPKPPSACYTLSATPRSATAGQRVRVVARVHLARTPIHGVQVFLRGTGVSAARTTGPTGRVQFVVTPRRRGVLHVSIRKAFDCPKRPPKRIGIVGAATPPVTG